MPPLQQPIDFAGIGAWADPVPFTICPGRKGEGERVPVQDGHSPLSEALSVCRETPSVSGRPCLATDEAGTIKATKAERTPSRVIDAQPEPRPKANYPSSVKALRFGDSQSEPAGYNRLEQRSFGAASVKSMEQGIAKKHVQNELRALFSDSLGKHDLSGTQLGVATLGISMPPFLSMHDWIWAIPSDILAVLGYDDGFGDVKYPDGPFSEMQYLDI
ncbi:hypothetical protein B0H66DRAFT_267437 [Apodospora peruviana]|uniref:Uncharacterized protein n=1 Tax=Apodospora peruviana TaxID=516989 RepID=A0AAE0M4Q9_9PEZI|nr:hypothetical protein B0H66DRAFT_267437 [Apodospora peruviana]